MENIEDHGASVTSTPAQNKCAIEAALACGPIYVPPKPFITDQIEVNSAPVIRGDKWASKLISTSPTSAVKINVVGAHIGTDIRDVSIVPKVADQGTHGLEFVMTPNGYMCDFRIRDVEIGQFGQHGIRFDNTISKMDGFFCGSIKESVVGKGFHGDKIGDSIEIDGNKIHGGVGTGVVASFVSGANQFILRCNNITTRGGGVSLQGATFSLVERNNIEHPGYLGDYAVIYGAMLHMYKCLHCELIGNTVNPMHGIMFDRGSGPVANKGSDYGILFEGVGCNYNISWRDKIGSSKVQRTFTYQGANNFFNDSFSY